MEDRRRVIALGFFDGVHIGHAALLRTVAERAAQLGAVPAAVTFDRHPEDVITGTRQVPLITSLMDRADLMNRLFGIQDVLVVHFGRQMMQMDWESFVERYLVGKSGAVHLVAGHDFRFGYRGEGNPERLREKCAQLGVGCDIVPKVEIDGVTVSSTCIRALIAGGEMERANRFLGHPYILSGEVAHGKKLGRALGFPTVNLALPEGVMPPAFGVYAAKVWVLPEDRRLGRRAEEGPYLAVTNVGVRPTVDDGDRVNVEGFLPDFDGDLYGRHLRMELFSRLREERRFPSLEALREEVMRNTEQVRAYFAARRE